FADLGPDNTIAVVRGTAKRRSIEYPVGRVLAEVPFIKNQSWLASGEFVTPRLSPSGGYVSFFDIWVPSAFRVKILDRGGKLVAESRPFLDWWSLAWTPANE